jgi:ABC-type branched-subunit amino acid transport system substrate-binding protein
MRRVRTSLFILLIGLASSLVAGDAREVFSKARQFYRAGEYDSTIVVIRDFLISNGQDPGAEYLIPLVMEAFARRDDMTPMASLYDLFRDKFSSSAFMPRVSYLYGYSQARQGLFIPALVAYSAALDAGVAGDLDSLVMASVAVIRRNAPALAASDELVRTPLNARIRAALAGAPPSDRADPVAAVKNPAPLPESDPPAAAAGGTDVFVGLLAPLTGDDADVGVRVERGVELAFEKHNEAHRTRVSIVKHDTRSSLIETARATRDLLGHDRLPAIIGPVLSPTATVSAGMLIGRETVMLTPTATDDGIAALGPNIFQMNITVGVLARSVARYALENLHIREFIILAPRTAVGAAMSDAFRDEVTGSGGTVFIEESYEEGASDYTALFVDLRKKLLVRTLDARARERGGNYRPVRSVSWADSARFADSSVSIGAIFLPSDASDLPALTSQLAFNRIRAQLLGSSGWRSPKTTVDENRYLQNAIISAPFEPDASWRGWPPFAGDYAARFHEDADRVAALGYDAGTLIADAIDSAGPSLSASRIAEVLSKLQKFEGASGLITFDPKRRDNTEAAILKLTPGGFVRLQ